MLCYLQFHHCYCRKVSRQEYLKKREEKKLEELRYDATSVSVRFFVRSHFWSINKLQLDCITLLWHASIILVLYFIVEFNSFSWLLQRWYRRWAISVWRREAFGSRISWTEVIYLFSGFLSSPSICFALLCEIFLFLFFSIRDSTNWIVWSKSHTQVSTIVLALGDIWYARNLFILENCKSYELLIIGMIKFWFVSQKYCMEYFYKFLLCYFHLNL